MSKYIETTLDYWEQIFKLDRYFLSPFVFRGQNDSSWSLSTSIERISSDFKNFKSVLGYNSNEKWMLYEFIRKSHLYANISIPVDDKFEWLAIMQHHGSPTRLLDFTESIFIATYFAIIDSKTNSSVWAINRHKLRDNLLDRFNLPYKKGVALKDEVNLIHIDYANKYIARRCSKEEKAPSTVVPLEPKMCSERLAKQQGMFLMPTNSEKTFMENLDSAFYRDNSELINFPFEKILEIADKEKLYSDIEILKINIPNNLYDEITPFLKEMNITAEVLFPGLDGLARSLIQTQILV